MEELIKFLEDEIFKCDVMKTGNFEHDEELYYKQFAFEKVLEFVNKQLES